MKRKVAIIFLALMMSMAMSLTVFGTEDTFSITKTSPGDGTTGASVDNMGVKVTFSEEVYSTENESANAALCHLTDEEGNEVPTVVAFSADSPNVMLVLADTENEDVTISGNTQYTLTIDAGFVSADGSLLAGDEDGTNSVTFTTLNPKTNSWVSMGMMLVMMVVMIVFTMRDTKKKVEQETYKKKEYEGVNPYKEAKRTGKSVAQIVAEDQKNREKFEAKEAKAAAKAAAKMAAEEDDEEEEDFGCLRVQRRRPISEAGSDYKPSK